MARVPPIGDRSLMFAIGCHDAPDVLVRRYGSVELAYTDAPTRFVTLSGHVWLMRYPVTNALFAAFIAARAAAGKPYITTAEQIGSAWALYNGKWERVSGACWNHPNGPRSDLEGCQRLPVTCVSWHDAQAFADWLTEEDFRLGHLSVGQRYRLPLEDEWEVACRACTCPAVPTGLGEPSQDRSQLTFPDCSIPMGLSAFWWGDQLDDEHAIHRRGHYPDRTGPAPIETMLRYGQGRCNPWGFSDMIGNVWEWCADLYALHEPTLTRSTRRVLGQQFVGWAAFVLLPGANAFRRMR